MNVSTDELCPGDIVVTHGMRCLIDREITRNDVTHTGLPVFWTQALVLNRDDAATNAVPRGWTADWDRNASRQDAVPHHGEHRWTIQGNERARWYVERT